MEKSKKNEQQWREIISRCKQREKGVTIPEWCKREHVLFSSYKYWRTKFKNENKQCITTDISNDTCFASLNIPVPVRHTSEISIRYQDFEIVVSEQSSQALMTRLFTAVRLSC